MLRSGEWCTAADRGEDPGEKLTVRRALQSHLSRPERAAGLWLKPGHARQSWAGNLRTGGGLGVEWWGWGRRLGLRHLLGRDPGSGYKEHQASAGSPSLGRSSLCKTCLCSKGIIQWLRPMGEQLDIHCSLQWHDFSALEAAQTFKRSILTWRSFLSWTVCCWPGPWSGPPVWSRSLPHAARTAAVTILLASHLH